MDWCGAFETSLFVVIQIFYRKNLLWRDFYYYMISGGFEEEWNFIAAKNTRKGLNPWRNWTLTHMKLYDILRIVYRKKICHLAVLYSMSPCGIPKQQPAHAAKRCRRNFLINCKRTFFITTWSKTLPAGFGFLKIYKIFQIKL